MPDPTIVVPLLGRVLLDFLWQGALIGLATAVALQLLRHARPQTRYAVACAALLACVLMPLATLLAQLTAGAAVAGTDASAPVASTALRLVSQYPTTELLGWPQDIDRLLPWIVALWATGAGGLSLRMAMGVIWIRRLRSTPQGAEHAAWQARLDALAARFGLGGIALRVIDSVDTPLSAGWLRPVVLMPAALLTRMPVDLIEALLAHELAHIRRHDYLVNLLQSAAEALLFYHPVTWWLSRRIRVERELIADRLAADLTGQPRRLAIALSELSDFARHRTHPLHLAQAAHGGHLMSRIEQLVRPGRRAAGGRIAFPLLGLAAVCIAFYAHAQIGETRPMATPQLRVEPAARPTTMPLDEPRTQADPRPQPAARVAQATTLHLGKKASGDAYALVRKGHRGMTMSGSTSDLREIEDARRSLDGDFVWVRRAGKAYVVTDPATVARAQAAWNETAKLGEQMEAIGDRMEVHGAKMEAIGEKMETVSGGHAESPAMEAAGRRMEELGRQQEKLARQQAKLAAQMADASEAQQEQLERQMETLSGQQDALSRQMDEQSRVMDAESDRLEAQLKPMEELGRQMEEAGKPMEALGEQMDALAERHDQLAEQAEREMAQIIGEAIQKGLAYPAPGRTGRQ